MIVYNQCPVCKSNQIHISISVKDHSVSQESFDIIECQTCTLRFTQGIPEMKNIGRYYQSENYISHTDSKKGIFNTTYQLVRSFSLHRKRKLIEHVSTLSHGTLLDYGCGTGSFLKEMSDHGWQIDGIEPDTGARDKGSALTNIKIKSTDELLVLKEHQYDVITLWHVLEHVHQLDETLLQLQKSLKPGGTLIVAVPNYTSHDAKFYGTFWAAYDVPRHLYHFSPKSMTHLMERTGLELIGTKPMWFDSFYVSLLSEKYKKSNLKLLKAFFVGIISNFMALINTTKCSSVIYIIKKPF